MSQSYKVVIVGSGFSGLCMGIKLKQAGVDDFVILEKAQTLGGTWRENTYPGAECDIPSALYSYSFEHNPKWKYKWSMQAQILEYQNAVASKYGLTPHFRFNQMVDKASFDEVTQRWQISCASGELFEAQHFVTALGQLHEVSIPYFAGLESFKGEHFHSAKWNHEVELGNKRIAVIGNAASAVQLVPEIAKQAQQVTVFQRSPNWMLPKMDRPYSKFEQWLSDKIPFLQKLYRAWLWCLGELLVFPAIRGNVLARAVVKLRCHWNLHKHIKDSELRKTLTPDYQLGAKRILFSHDYYRTLERDNVALETNGIASFTDSGIRTEEGAELAFDVVVFATGFQTNPFLKSIDITGLKNKKLATAWAEGAHAYLGIATHGYPNLHMVYGPNTNLGHNSTILMIEDQVSFIVRAIVETNVRQAASIQVKAEVESHYNRELQQRLATMAFSQVSDSWYMQNGKITNNWAGGTREYRRRLRQVEWSDFIFA